MKSLTDVFRSLHTLQSEGVVVNYAVGGTIAALFYAEALHCFELSVCTLGLNQLEGQHLSNWAQKYSFVFRDGLIVVHGVPVRLLEQHDALQREAVGSAELKQYGDVSVRVMRAEHLVTFYLNDHHSRWGYSPSYFAPEMLDRTFLEVVLKSAGLLSKWRFWQEREHDIPSDTDRFRSKQQWNEENARLPVREKVWQLLQLQKHDLPLIAARRPLKWYEKPWDIEP
ncbi:hypothetical protein IAD21_02989 [Abditibacteriota bacterium]|nr:hypothetical protein IAD21_02989 [Abditibacteriota bacterium]